MKLLFTLLLTGCVSDAGPLSAKSYTETGKSQHADEPSIMKDKFAGGLLYVPVGKTYAETKRNHDIVWKKAVRLCGGRSINPEVDDFFELPTKKYVQNKKALILEFSCP